MNLGYGTALDNSQLSGTASVPGSFSYTTAAGAQLSAGNGQSENVTFTPTDTLDSRQTFGYGDGYARPRYHARITVF